MHAPTCPYCSAPAQLVTGLVIYGTRPEFSELAGKKYWRCEPCGAHVGCHRGGDGTEPLGRLADAHLRMWKTRAHSAFDPYWKRQVELAIEKNGGKAPKRIKTEHRTAAYQRLAAELGIEITDCHIGMFDRATCERVIGLCMKWNPRIR